MPYIKDNDPHKKAKMLLRCYDINPQRLAIILGKSEPTARSRLRNPGSLTGNEWMKIHKKGHVPIDEIREVFLS